MGMRRPTRAKARSMPSSAALMLRVSWQVSTSRIVGAAVDEALGLHREVVDQLVEGRCRR